jgi:hypothetical protein
MNFEQAIKKINKLLGLYKFTSYKVAGTEQELISEGELAVGEPIYVITENGQLPAPDNTYELDDTTKIKVEDGLVKELKYDMENQTESFTEATLKDGTVLKSPTFDLGEDVSVVGTDGKETPAPDGEHEIALKDSEGKEVIIRIVTKDGKITERENVEEANPEMPETGEEMGMVPDLSEGNDIMDENFKKTLMGVLGEIKDAIGGIVKDQEEMKAKVAKFSKEPAGEPIRVAKNVISEISAAKDDYISQLVNVRRNSYTKK